MLLRGFSKTSTIAVEKQSSLEEGMMYLPECSKYISKCIVCKKQVFTKISFFSKKRFLPKITANCPISKEREKKDSVPELFQICPNSFQAGD